MVVFPEFLPIILVLLFLVKQKVMVAQAQGKDHLIQGGPEAERDNVFPQRLPPPYLILCDCVAVHVQSRSPTPS